MTGVSELVLEVADLDAATRFYTEVLGLPLVAPAPDVDPLPEPLAPPAPPLWANADVASIAPARVSASALIHVFITVLLNAVRVLRRRL